MIKNNKAEMGKVTKPNIKTDEPTEKRADVSTAMQNVYLFYTLCLFICSVYVAIQINHMNNNNRAVIDNVKEIKPEIYLRNETLVHVDKKPIYWTNAENSTSFGMVNIHSVLKYIGFESNNDTTDWDLLWSYHYPFPHLDQRLMSMKPHQLVNQIPGSSPIVNKVLLSTTNSKYIPKSFSFPRHTEEFEQYVEENPDALFLTKSNQHRGVKLVNVSDIDVTNKKSFVQRFVDKPHLIEGHKYDFGVFVLTTSVDPLRIYIYNADVLYRFCVNKFHPLDPEDLNKYVTSESRLTVEDLPVFAPHVVGTGYSAKAVVDNYIRQQGKNPSLIWKQVQEFIVELYQGNLQQVLAQVIKYPWPNNFFQMLRFDFMVDEDLNLFVLESNMSPNMMSKSEYRTILSQQVLYSALGLVGVGRIVKSPSLDITDKEIVEMDVSNKNIIVLEEQCLGDQCKTSCEGVCALCITCLNENQKTALKRAYREHMERKEWGRAFPPPMVHGDDLESSNLSRLPPSNRLMHMWFQAKCNQDVNFCN